MTRMITVVMNIYMILPSKLFFFCNTAIAHSSINVLHSRNSAVANAKTSRRLLSALQSSNRLNSFVCFPLSLSCPVRQCPPNCAAPCKGAYGVSRAVHRTSLVRPAQPSDQPSPRVGASAPPTEIEIASRRGQRRLARPLLPP